MRVQFRAFIPMLTLVTILAGVGCGGKPASPPNDGSPFGRQQAVSGQGPFTATHILIGSKNDKAPQITRSKSQALVAALAVIEKLKAGTKLESMVALYTDDPGSVGRGTEPDGQYTFGQGSMVPAFEKAVRETPVGKIYPDPVESEYGYHIIRRDK